MIRRLVLPILFGLIISACGTMEPSPAPETIEASPTPELEEIAFPSGTTMHLDAHIQESTQQQLRKERGGYFLLQFSAPLDQDTRATLEAADVIFYDYIPNYAYYVYLPAESLAILERLIEAGTLGYVGPIPIEAKLEAGLREKILANADQRFDVVVQFFEAPSPAAKTELEALMEVREYAFGAVNLAEGTVAASDVETILALPFVKWMEEQVMMELGD
ncbi:MAG: hypothetical protein JXR84_04930 [Anaerolineae bacterium]|nr:hypothetical protein [Anaerolineae bacterium]